VARKKKATVGAAARPQPRSWTSAIGPLLRALALAAFAVAGAAWALVRYYTHPRPSMVVAVPVVDAASLDGEIPAPDLQPELEPEPAGHTPAPGGGR
jgi:hypothetical protein